MDYVYTCKPGPNEELRYSLRSISKNLPDVNVWIIGDAPDWYTGNLIKNDRRRDKYAVVRQNLTILTETNQINEDFILMNDDFFVMKPLESIQTWHGGLLYDRYRDRMQLEPYSTYTKYLIETYNTIKNNGINDPLSYELHTPLPMTKSALRFAVKQPGLWRSIASNLDGIGGEQHDDVKLYHPASRLYRDREDFKDSLYISSDDESFDVLLNKYLAKEFSDPCKYEMD